MTATTDKDPGACLDPDLLARMAAGGLERSEAWIFKPRTSTGPTLDEAERMKKKAAERQSAKAARDANDNWARCYAKAPDDDDARMIVSAVARAIKAPEFRLAIRLALANPHSVFIGEKVRTFRGIRAYLTRALVGAIGMPASSGSS